jgi:hypothetical protein
MSATIFLMSYSIHGRVNVGAYERPFSGVGIEFAPLATKPGQTGIVLHEAGYLSANRNWKFPSVFRPFWRLYYNQKGGHHARFGESRVELTPEHIMLIQPRCLCHLLGVSPSFPSLPATRRPCPCPSRSDAKHPTPNRQRPSLIRLRLIRPQPDRTSALRHSRYPYKHSPSAWRVCHWSAC